MPHRRSDGPPRPDTALRMWLPLTAPAPRPDVLPTATAHTLLLAAARLNHRPTWSPLLAALNSAMPRSGIRAYQRVLNPEQFFPAAILPLTALTPSWVGDYAAAVVAADPDKVRDALLTRYDDQPPSIWRGVVDHPTRWLQDIAHTIEAVAPTLSAIWRIARPHIEADTARIEQILRRAGPEVLLNGVSTRVSYSDNEIRVTHQKDIRHPTPDAFTLTPMIATPSSFLLFGPQHNTHLAYPTPSARTAFQASARPPAHVDQLAAILGPVRAGMLRELATPHTLGALAHAVGNALSTVSYHCTGLATAGLVDTVRIGRSVWIVRTPRGSELAELFPSATR